jgi:hypothetical protein
MIRGGIIFSAVISQVCGAKAPVDLELFPPCDTILDPIKNAYPWTWSFAA